MNNSEKILKTLSNLIENGILSSKDLKKEISTDLKFKREKLINKLELVPREEFEILKKIVKKQQLTINRLSKMKIKNLIVTRGRAGAVMFSKNNKIINAASFAKEIVDKIGAGDCLFGFLSLFLSSKFDEELSLFLSSLAAGKNVEVLGNSSYINYNDFLKTINYCLK